MFFVLSFSWFGETAAALIAPFGFIIDVGPALAEALAFAFAALIASLARGAARRRAPFVAAAAFTAGEWMRSSGILGVPFGQFGLPLVDSPLRPLAAFASTRSPAPFSRSPRRSRSARRAHVPPRREASESGR